MRLNVPVIKSVLNLYDELVDNGISLVYLGEFSHDITKMFTSMAKDDMEKSSEERTLRKRVYHVMVETLQNINKHSDELTDSNIGRGLFIIGRKEQSYFIITCNKVSSKKKKALSTSIEAVNNATKEELKEMYMTQIRDGELSDKGGAGLGLIDIARKTGKKYDYKFLDIESDEHLFIMKVEITSTSRKIHSDSLKSTK